jgi:protein-L-isoaspartate O-methyltransferase
VTREPTAPAKDQEVSNKNTEKKPTTEPTPEVKSKLQANKNSEKLRKVADNLREKSEESLNQNRNDNTARRARMADGARDSARADLEFANTLTKLADAMDKGEVKSLVNIGSKVDLARLESVFRRAENKAARELGKAEKDLTTAEIAKYVETNKMRAYLSRSDVEKISPSSYGKATKAGVDLKGFLKAAQGDWITISKWEKEIEYAVKNATSIGIDSYSVRNMGEELTTYRALEKIKGSSSFADIFDELKMIKEGAKVVETPAEILKRKERDLVQRTSIEGFFPTPEKTVSRMIEEAGIEKGMTVLEPSAGIGSIADQIRAAGIEPDVGEYASSLSQHLTDKGYNVVSSDFMDLPKSKKYDRIIMNPPFERLQDVDHVMKAYDHLNDGGRIVAIMGESAFFNSTKKAVEFRDWLDKVGGYEKLPEGTFKDSLRSTGVATRMVFIDKIGNSEIIEAVNKGEDLTYLSKRKPK